MENIQDSNKAEVVIQPCIQGQITVVHIQFVDLEENLRFGFIFFGERY